MNQNRRYLSLPVDLLITLIFVILAPLAQAASAVGPHTAVVAKIVNLCAVENSLYGSDKIACLNAEFHKSFMEGGFFQRRMKSDLADLLRVQRLENTREPQPMTQFRVRVPETQRLVLDSQCFLLNSGKGRIRYTMTKVLNTMLQAATFLQEFHVVSLGRDSSVLFQVRQIDICDFGKEATAMAFEDGVLSLNVNSDGRSVDEKDVNQVLTAKVIMEMWNRGEAFKKMDRKSFLQKMKSFFDPSIEPAQIENLVRRSWIVLDPVGKIRKNLRYIFFRFLLPTIKGIYGGLRANPQNLRPYLQNVMKQPGFKPEMVDYVNRASQEKLEEIALRMSEKMSSPLFIGEIAGGIMTSPSQTCSGSRNSVTADRKQEGKILNLSNAKNIAVDLSVFGSGEVMKTFLQKDIEFKDSVQTDCSGQVHVKDHQTGALVNISLIDNVQVNVQLPTRMSHRVAGLALYGVLEEIWQQNFSF